MLSRWAMQFRRARIFTSALTTYHGACLMSVWLNISSLARAIIHPFHSGSEIHGAEFPAFGGIFHTVP